MPLSLVVQVPDGAVVLSSRSLDRAAIEAAARELDLDNLAEPPAALAGLDLVGEGQMGFSRPHGRPQRIGHLVGYQDEEGSRSLTVTTAAGDDGDLASLRWQLGPEAEAVDVDGTTGWAGRPFGHGSASLAWQRADGVIVSLSGSGFEVEDLVEAAGSLRVATDEEWDALLEATGSLVPRDALAGVSSVDEDDGETYGVYIDAEDGLCLALETEERLGIDVLGSDRCPHRCEHGPARLRPGAPRRLHHPRHTGRGRPPPRRRSHRGSSANSEDGTLLATTLTDAELSSQVQVVGSDGTVLGEVPVRPPRGAGRVPVQGTATTIASGG